MRRFLPLALVIAAGCSGSRDVSDFKADEVSKQFAQSEAASPAVATGGMTVASPMAPDKTKQAPVERQIVRTGAVSLRVDRLTDAESKLRRLASTQGGWIDALEGDNAHTLATLRVPSAAFDATMDGVLALGRPMARKVAQEDVTEQVVDLIARMKALRAEETAYVGMLAKTRNLQDTLTVRDRLGQLRQEIERADATRLNLARQASMSTLAVTMWPMPVAKPQGDDPGWFASRLAGAVGSFGSVARALASVAIYGTVFSPIWVPVLWFGWRRRVPAVRAPRAS